MFLIYMFSSRLLRVQTPTNLGQSYDHRPNNPDFYIYVHKCLYAVKKRVFVGGGGPAGGGGAEWTGDDGVIIRKQFVLCSADFTTFVPLRPRPQEHSEATIFPAAPALGVYAAHEHKLQFVWVTFMKSYKHHSCRLLLLDYGK